MAASEDKLGSLHDKVADVMINALDRAEKKAEVEQDIDEGIFPEEVNPALLSVATKFLKDNDITCAAGEGSKVSELEEKLKQRRKKTIGNVTHIGIGE